MSALHSRTVDSFAPPEGMVILRQRRLTFSAVPSKLPVLSEAERPLSPTFERSKTLGEDMLDFSSDVASDTASVSMTSPMESPLHTTGTTGIQKLSIVTSTREDETTVTTTTMVAEDRDDIPSGEWPTQSSMYRSSDAAASYLTHDGGFGSLTLRFLPSTAISVTTSVKTTAAESAPPMPAASTISTEAESYKWGEWGPELFRNIAYQRAFLRALDRILEDIKDLCWPEYEPPVEDDDDEEDEDDVRSELERVSHKSGEGSAIARPLVVSWSLARPLRSRVSGSGAGRRLRKP